MTYPSNREYLASLRTAKFLQTAFIFSPLIYLLVLYYLGVGDNAIARDEYILNIMVPALSLIGVLSLVMGSYMPRLMMKQYKKQAQPRVSGSMMISIQVIRGSFFEAIAVYGLMLGIFGAGWGLVLAFIGASLTALVLSFPTEERWNRMAEG